MSDSPRHVSRRRVLKGISGIGLSAATFGAVTGSVTGQQESGSSKKKQYIEEYKVTYPNGMNSQPTIEPITGTVDRGYWQEMMAAEAAAAQVRQTLAQNGLDQRATVSVKTENSRQELIDPTISVDYNAAKTLPQTEAISSKQAEIESIKSNVPKKAEGRIEDEGKTISRSFDVIVDTIEKKPATTPSTADIDWKYDSEYRPVPGGCHITTPNTNGSHGTLCHSFWEPDSSARFHITASHVLADGGTQENPEYSTRVYQPYSDGIGSTKRSACVYEDNFEAGFVEPQSVDPGYINKMANQDGSKTDNYVSYFKDWQWLSTDGKTTDITKQGARTGETSGSVYAADKSNWTFWMEASMNGGDSGGPSYIVEDGKIKLVGMMLWSTSTPQQAGGNAIAGLNDRLGLVP
ncbi:hypothetical protein [Halobacterium noricense]|uniref:hypothetical protein n=1 Tax=Halobacterium noricense TaxID=223182 RepID=UPI001E2F9D90|nr:hypothetical protein [Halobacterium noricense]UHH24042.1 hypothetical protein LT974_08550 [Halobacterium noricense]